MLALSVVLGLHIKFCGYKKLAISLPDCLKQEGSIKLSATTKLDTLPDCVIQAGKYNPDSYRDHLTTELPIFCRYCVRPGMGEGIER